MNTMDGNAGRRLALIGLSLLLTSLPVRAQTNVTWNGYLEHQYRVSYGPRRWTHLDYDRARVDVNAVAGRRSVVSVAAVGQLYRGNTETRLRDVLPDALADVAGAARIPLEDRFYLNHAFITLHPGPLEITAGKQYLAWGAAYVFNPTELFRPKNVFEPGYEREGVGAITVRVPFGALSDVLVGLAPEEDLAYSGALLRVRHHVSGFDVSAVGAVVHESGLPERLPAAGDTLNRRLTVGGDVTGEVLGLGVWTEAAYTHVAGTNRLEATAGGNYTFRDGTLLLVEGHYDSRAKWGKPYPASWWLGRLTGNVRTLGRTEVYASVQRPVGAFQLWHIGLAALVNPGDPSGVLIPSVAYAFAENVDVLFNGVVQIGRDGSEYRGPQYGGFIRARVYF